MRYLIADWGNLKRARFDQGESGLTALGHEVHRISRHGMEHRPELLTAIRSGHHDVLLTWQRFFRMQRDILGSIADSGIATLFMDFGFVPHYDTVVFDRDGENAVSSWPNMWRTGTVPHIPSQFEDAADKHLDDLEQRRERLPAAFSLLGIREQRPFIFVPLQRTGDSVLRFDSDATEFRSLVNRVIGLAGDRYFVVIKPHPLDRNIDLGLPDHLPRRHLIVRRWFGAKNEELCDSLLAQANAVVGINSNMLFRATNFGSPTIAVGRGWYCGSGVMREVDGVVNLHSLEVSRVHRHIRRRYLSFALSGQLTRSEVQDPESLGGLLRRVGLQPVPSV